MVTKILVTGGGFVGRHLIKRLFQESMKHTTEEDGIKIVCEYLKNQKSTG